MLSWRCAYFGHVRRPLNRILIAQRIAAPQMFISIVVAALHVMFNYLLIHVAGLGFLGAAYAIGIASLNNTLLTAAWVALSGMQGRVWGRLTWDAFKVGEAPLAV
jgi:MATE family multidrug resistance protein